MSQPNRLFAPALVLHVLPIAAAGQADPIIPIINQVTPTEYQSYIRLLSGADPLYSNPPYYLTTRQSRSWGANIAADWLTERFESWGLATTRHIFNYSYAPNVIAELPGLTRPQDVYVFCAHFDDVAGTPGADDNASGTSAVLTAARILSQYQFDATIRFIAFSGEEQGLVGSWAYAQAMRNEGQNIAAVLNFDMLLHPGWDNTEPDPDYDLDIGTDDASWWLAQDLAAHFATYTPIDIEVGYEYYGASDHYPFWLYDFNAVVMSEHSAPEIWWDGANDAYHQPTDSFDNPDYDYEFARQAVRGSMAELIDLAGLVPEPTSAVGLLAVLTIAGYRRRAGNHLT
jgi:hypothetical protein